MAQTLQFYSVRIISLISLLFLTFSAAAQSFHRGAVVLDLNGGFELYKTSQTYEAKTVPGLRDTTVASSAANANASAAIEIGLGKRIGFGVRGKANSFFRDVDAITRDRSKLKSTDLLLMVNLHPFVVEKFDLAIGAEAGLSAFNLSIDNIAKTITKGNGTYMSLYLNPRLYFGRLGINVKALMPFVNYNKLTTESSFPEKGEFLLKAWKGSGGGLTVGVQLRLF